MVQVGVYLPLYDYCLGRLWGPTGIYAPLLAGSIARMVAVMFSAPLELMRTRMQVRSPLFCHISPAHAKSLYHAEASPVQPDDRSLNAAINQQGGT